MKHKKGIFAGVARNVKWQTEDSGEFSLTFNIEETDEDGNTDTHTTVILVGGIIGGELIDGDEIEVQGKREEYHSGDFVYKWEKDSDYGGSSYVIVNPREVTNLTDRSFIHHVMHFAGVARNVERGTENLGKFSFLRFSLERTDEDGNTFAYIPVELIGEKIIGSLIDGDELWVVGKREKCGIKNPESISNSTSDSSIIAEEGGGAFQVLGRFLSKALRIKR